MEAFATASILAYTFAVAVLGVRLLVMFLRRGAPTGLLAVALLFGGAPVLIFARILSTVEEWPGTVGWQLIEAGFLISAGIAGVCVMRFTHEVFHPRSRVLPWLTGGVCVYLAFAASTLPFSDPRPGGGHTAMGIGAYCLLLVIYGWTSCESFRYWRIYRRVPDLDRFVVDRFRMWAIAAASIIPVVGLQFLARYHPLAHAAGAIFGLLCTAALWLAFLPPRWYRRRLAVESPGESPDGGA